MVETHSTQCGLSQKSRAATKYGVLSVYGLGKLTGGRIIPTISGGRGRDFQELGHRPLFALLWSASEVSWCLRVCHLSCASVSP